jgi:hypothetical protein
VAQEDLRISVGWVISLAKLRNAVGAYGNTRKVFCSRAYCEHPCELHEHINLSSRAWSWDLYRNSNQPNTPTEQPLFPSPLKYLTSPTARGGVTLISRYSNGSDGVLLYARTK